MRIVNADAARDVQPLQNVVRQRGVEHVTVLAVAAQVAVVGPIGILHRDAAVAHRPILLRDLVHGIVTLVHLDILPVTAAGKKVGSCQRVVVRTLVNHVKVLLQNVVCPDVKPHAVVQKRRRVAKCEVVAIVGVVRHDTLRIDRGSRQIGLILLRTGRQRDALGVGHPRTEIILAGIVAHAVGPVEPLAPAVAVDVNRRREVARAVTVLELRQHERRHHLDTGRGGHRELPGLSLLRRNDDGAVGSIRTIEGGGRSTGQHRDRLDVLGIDVGNGIGRTLRSKLRTAVLGLGEHRHTIDHVEGVRRLRDGFRTAHDHLRGSAHARRRGIDRHTSHLTVKRINEVGILVGRNRLGGDLLDVVRQGLFGTLDTECRNDDRLHLDRLGLQHDIERRTVADGQRDSLIADETD